LDTKLTDAAHRAKVHVAICQAHPDIKTYASKKKEHVVLAYREALFEFYCSAAAVNGDKTRITKCRNASRIKDALATLPAISNDEKATKKVKANARAFKKRLLLVTKESLIAYLNTPDVDEDSPSSPRLQQWSGTAAAAGEEGEEEEEEGHGPPPPRQKPQQPRRSTTRC
jgi:hypothetical protein